MVLYLFAKQEVWVQIPSQLLIKKQKASWRNGRRTIFRLWLLRVQVPPMSFFYRYGNSLRVERYIVTIKMWVQIPFTTNLILLKKDNIWSGPIA